MIHKASTMRNNAQMRERRNKRGVGECFANVFLLVEPLLTQMLPLYLFLNLTLLNLHNIIIITRPTCANIQNLWLTQKNCGSVISHPKLPLQNSWQIFDIYNILKVKPIRTTQTLHTKKTILLK